MNNLKLIRKNLLLVFVIFNLFGCDKRNLSQENNENIMKKAVYIYKEGESVKFFANNQAQEMFVSFNLMYSNSLLVYNTKSQFIIEYTILLRNKKEIKNTINISQRVNERNFLLNQKRYHILKYDSHVPFTGKTLRFTHPKESPIKQITFKLKKLPPETLIAISGRFSRNDDPKKYRKRWLRLAQKTQKVIGDINVYGSEKLRVDEIKNIVSKNWQRMAPIKESGKILLKTTFITDFSVEEELNAEELNEYHFLREDQKYSLILLTDSQLDLKVWCKKDSNNNYGNIYIKHTDPLLKTKETYKEPILKQGQSISEFFPAGKVSIGFDRACYFSLMRNQDKIFPSNRKIKLYDLSKEISPTIRVIHKSIHEYSTYKIVFWRFDELDQKNIQIEYLDKDFKSLETKTLEVEKLKLGVLNNRRIIYLKIPKKYTYFKVLSKKGYLSFYSTFDEENKIIRTLAGNEIKKSWYKIEPINRPKFIEKNAIITHEYYEGLSSWDSGISLREIAIPDPELESISHDFYFRTVQNRYKESSSRNFCAVESDGSTVLRAVTEGSMIRPQALVISSKNSNTSKYISLNVDGEIIKRPIEGKFTYFPFAKEKQEEFKLRFNSTPSLRLFANYCSNGTVELERNRYHELNRKLEFSLHRDSKNTYALTLSLLSKINPNISVQANLKIQRKKYINIFNDWSFKNYDIKVLGNPVQVFSAKGSHQYYFTKVFMLIRSDINEGKVILNIKNRNNDNIFAKFTVSHVLNSGEDFIRMTEGFL